MKGEKKRKGLLALSPLRRQESRRGTLGGKKGDNLSLPFHYYIETQKGGFQKGGRTIAISHAPTFSSTSSRRKAKKRLLKGKGEGRDKTRPCFSTSYPSFFINRKPMKKKKGKLGGGKRPRATGFTRPPV